MKKLITNYTFDASAKTITFTDYVSILAESVLLITNVTDNIIIYNFADPTKGGTVATNVLTLTYDTTSMSDTDDIQIFYQDETASQLVDLGSNNDVTVTGSVTANAGTNLNTSALALETTATSIKNAVETIDNAISGSEMQVDVITMPTTTVQATDLDIRPLVNTDIVTAELSATDNAVLDDIAANQTDGTHKTQIVDAGGEAVTVTGGKLDVNATASLAGETLPVSGATEAVAVAIVDSSGNQISSFGGGTQYTEGDTDASITGTAALVEGAANALAVLTQPLTDTQLRASAVPVSATDLDIRNLTATDVVTAELSATDNAVLDTIAVNTGEALTDAELRASDVKITLDGESVTISNASGASAVNVQDGGNSLTVDQPTAANLNMTEVNSDAIKTAVETIDNAISGSEMQVDVVTIPTHAVYAQAYKASAVAYSDMQLDSSDNLLVKAAANGGVDIGDVTINNTTANPVPIQPPASGYLNIAIDQTGNNNAVDVLTLPGDVEADIDQIRDQIDLITPDVEEIRVDADAIRVAVETLDNAISGSEMQVDVVAALPAGTNTLGAVKSVPSDIDINGSNANHADKYYTNAGAVTDGIIWSPAAGKRWHILTLYINVSADATVTLEDDLAGGDVVRWKGELAGKSGVILTYDKEHPFCSGEDAADLIITTTAGNVYVQAVGYEV